MKDLSEIHERGFGDILDHLNSGIYVTDTDRRIVYWNSKAEQITGYPAEDVMGRPCSANILRHRDKDGRVLCRSDLCPLHRSMELNAPSERPILVYAESKDGRQLALLTQTAPVLDEEGRVIGGIEIFRDESQQIRQMELARSVQRQMLTRRLPDHRRVTFGVQYAPVELVSGDIYRVSRLSEDEFSLFLGDAAGHGVSAALSTSLIYSLLIDCQEALADPAALMAQLNRRACQRATGLGFFTAAALTVEAPDGQASFCTAGHPPPLLQRHGSEQPAEPLTLANLPVGVDPSADYSSRNFRMEPGDRLLLYSDGATDVVTGPADERLGMEGLARLLASRPPEEDPQMSGLFADLMDACRTVEPPDDITLLSCSLNHE
jgi:PAS domain S-box-containing protein